MNLREKYRHHIHELLGGKCVKCGFSDERAFQIDHVKNNGAFERKKYPSRRNYLGHILKQILAGSKDYQLLCANCNVIKEFDRHQLK